MRPRAFARLSRNGVEADWSSDRRLARRRRTRLRTCRLYDRHGSFLLECRLVDRSLLGARIATDYQGDLPARIAFYDEEKRELSEAEIIWRDSEICGLSFRGRKRADTKVRARFGAIFHAMRDTDREAG